MNCRIVAKKMIIPADIDRTGYDFILLLIERVALVVLILSESTLSLAWVGSNSYACLLS